LEIERGASLEIVDKKMQETGELANAIAQDNANAIDNVQRTVSCRIKVLIWKQNLPGRKFCR